MAIKLDSGSETSVQDKIETTQTEQINQGFEELVTDLSKRF